MLTSKLKLVDNGDAGVVFPQVGFAIADEVANATEARTVIKIDFAKIDILVLRSHAPVSSERVLQSATDHPADVCLYLFSTFLKKISETTNALEKIEITDGKSTGHIRQPPAKGIAKSVAQSLLDNVF